MCRPPKCSRRRPTPTRRKTPRLHQVSLRAQAGRRRIRTERPALWRHMPIALTFLWRELSGRARRRPAACLDYLASFLRLVLVRFPCGIAVLIVREGCRERSGGDGCQEYCEDDAFHGLVPFWLIDRCFVAPPALWRERMSRRFQRALRSKRFSRSSRYDRACRDPERTIGVLVSPGHD